MLKTLLSYLLILILPTSIIAQNQLKGQVTDEYNKPLAFVNILVNGDNRKGIITDIDGHFTFENIQNGDALHLSYLGYEAFIYKVSEVDLKNELVLTMKAVTYKFEEVTVIAGENPAHRIIKNVVANRNLNNPDKYEKYRCQTYNKMRFSLVPNEVQYKEDSQKKPSKNQAEEDIRMKNSVNFSSNYYLTIMETVTDKQFIAPNFHKEVVLHNKVSGFKRPDFVSLAKDAQPFSFYQSQITILEETYINPISRGSTKIYYFNWTDTLINGQDTTFIITYQPKKGKTFEGLKGVLYIHSNQYAIQNIIAEPADEVQTTIRIEQKYKWHDVDKKWFPEQLSMEWFMDSYPSKYVGLKIDGKSYIKTVDFQPDIKARDFTRDKYEMADDVFKLEDEGWKKERIDSLTTKEIASYTFIDSLSRKYKFEQQMYAIEAGLSSKWDLGKVDLDINQLIGFNGRENFRLGLGFHTNDDLIKNVSIGGYGAYGWRDRIVKYGGDIRFNLSKKYKTYVKGGYVNDIKGPGEIELPRWEYPFSSFSDNLFRPVLDDFENIYAEIGSAFLKFGIAKITYSNQNIQTKSDYFYNDGTQTFQNFDFQETQINLRYAHGEQTVNFMGTELPNETKSPILLFNATYGLWENTNSNYQKYVFGATQSIPLHRFGTFEYSIEAGIINGEVPQTKLFNSRGVGTGYKTIALPNTFQTMEPNEFYSNQFVHLFLKYNIGTLTKSSTSFQPELILVHQLAWGTLNNPTVHQGVEWQTLEKGFFESGVEINNLYRINYLNIGYLGIGGGVYMRHGAYQFDDFQSNLGYRLVTTFGF